MEWVEIVDVLYRFGLGQDQRDRDMFSSAFAGYAELDFQPAAARWGGVSPLLQGRDKIVETIFTVLSGVDTTHVVTNPRVEIDGSQATLTALVEAQHLKAGDHSQFALLKNFYEVAVVREDGRWVASKIEISNYWYQGDPTLFFG